MKYTLVVAALFGLALCLYVASRPIQVPVEVTPVRNSAQNYSSTEPVMSVQIESSAPVVAPSEVLTPEQQELLDQAKTCYSEASRTEQDCYAIRMVAKAIRGCVNSEGRYTRCARPHVRRETTAEALRRHSGRVLGVKYTNRRRLLLIREFSLDTTRVPPSLTPEEWEQIRPYWEEVISWARRAVQEEPRVCSRTPITWGGDMDVDHPIRRCLVRVNCGRTSNHFYAQGTCPVNDG